MKRLAVNGIRAGVVAAVHTYEGAGFGVFRPLPAPGLDLLDPFLLIDEMEPVDHPPGRAMPSSPWRSAVRPWAR